VSRRAATSIACATYSAIALVGVSLAGCGSGTHGATATAARAATPTSTDASSTTRVVTVSAAVLAARARLIARADAICAVANAHVAPVNGELQQDGEHSEYAAAASTLRSTLAYERAVLARLQALPAPEGDAEALAAIWTAAATQVEDVSALVGDFDKGNLVEAQTTESQLQRDYAAYGQLARHYGMSNCGSG
jgi:hypothetical protein